MPADAASDDPICHRDDRVRDQREHAAKVASRATGTLRETRQTPPTLMAMETAIPDKGQPDLPKGPSQRTLRGLDWLNFLLADVRTGVAALAFAILYFFMPETRGARVAQA